MNRLLAIAALSSFLLACPKNNSGPSLSGSDDEQMDSIAAKLEEFHTQSPSECGDICSLKGKVCSLSSTACDIAGKTADRVEYQKRCVSAQEECAHFGEACSSCRK